MLKKRKIRRFKLDLKQEKLKTFFKLARAKEKLRKLKEEKEKKAEYKLSCGAIIFKIDKGILYYLLLKYPTYWGFVKGLVELEETEEQTIEREAAEETGLYDLRILPGFRQVQRYFYRFENQLIRKEAVFRLARTESWKIKISHEHENYKWCTYEQAIFVLKRIKANVALLTKAHNFLFEQLKQKGVFEFSK